MECITIVLSRIILYGCDASKGYEFKMNPPLNKNARKVYDYYDGIDAHCTIYSGPNERIDEVIDANNPGEVLRQAPNPECRNIPSLL